MDQLPTQTGWERELVTKLAQSNLKEARAKRRWSIFFKLVWLALAIAVFAALMGWIGRGVSSSDSVGRHTALVKLEGEIADGGKASAENINAALAAAFKDPDSVAVVLNINSPGGSPVQSARIYNEIKRLRKDYQDKPIYVVVDELCASGGYYVAAAADKIFVNGSSLVGSIGVIYQGFGADKAMEKLGLENRTVTAGENKAFMDPFAPMKPEHKAHLEAMLADVHQQFIKAVKEPRLSNWIRRSVSSFCTSAYQLVSSSISSCISLRRACACCSASVPGVCIKSSRRTDRVGSISRFLRSSASVRTMA